MKKLILCLFVLLLLLISCESISRAATNALDNVLYDKAYEASNKIADSLIAKIPSGEKAEGTPIPKLTMGLKAGVPSAMELKGLNLPTNLLKSISSKEDCLYVVNDSGIMNFYYIGSDIEQIASDISILAYDFGYSSTVDTKNSSLIANVKYEELLALSAKNDMFFFAYKDTTAFYLYYDSEGLMLYVLNAN